MKEYEWLQVQLSEDDDKTLMFCTWCKESKKKNPFGTTGSSNLQKSALDRHANSNPEHLDVVCGRQMIKSKTTVKDVIEVKEYNQKAENAESKVHCIIVICISCAFNVTPKML